MLAVNFSDTFETKYALILLNQDINIYKDSNLKIWKSTF